MRLSSLSFRAALLSGAILCGCTESSSTDTTTTSTTSATASSETEDPAGGTGTDGASTGAVELPGGGTLRATFHFVDGRSVDFEEQAGPAVWGDAGLDLQGCAASSDDGLSLAVLWPDGITVGPHPLTSAGEFGPQVHAGNFSGSSGTIHYLGSNGEIDFSATATGPDQPVVGTGFAIRTPGFGEELEGIESVTDIEFDCLSFDLADLPCEYEEDGECDEPEGTGFCEEGTDVVDCGG